MSNSKPNYTPVFDDLIPIFGTMGALVYGVIWRYCQMRDGACHATHETLAQELGIGESTVRRHVENLRDAQYLAVIFDKANASNWIILGEKQVGRENTSEKAGVQREQAGVQSEHLPKGEQVSRENTEETKVLKKPVKKPRNATHSRKRKGRPFWNEDQKVLADHFSEVSGLPIPKLEGAFAAVTRSWKLPLSQMFELVGSVTDARKLIAQTVREMRAENLTIAAPRSIWKVALSIHGRQQTNGNSGLTGMDALKWVHDHAEELVDG
ncbi:MAG: helix-turn-helix domain-containing protein [Chloroflexi bacterium]|nr:helix-turn-helix domain-containing protein [Chloroflexota bacterium]